MENKILSLPCELIKTMNKNKVSNKNFRDFITGLIETEKIIPLPYELIKTMNKNKVSNKDFRDFITAIMEREEGSNNTPIFKINLLNYSFTMLKLEMDKAKGLT